MAGAVLLISILAECLFSESSVSIVGTGLYFILPGLLLNKDIVETSEQEKFVIDNNCNHLLQEE